MKAAAFAAAVLLCAVSFLPNLTPIQPDCYVAFQLIRGEKFGAPGHAITWSSLFRQTFTVIPVRPQHYGLGIQ